MAPLSDFPAPHIVQSVQNHSHTIIALHGRGSNGPEFAEELFEDRSSSNLTLAEQFPACKWIFPSSQERYSTVFQEEMNEWFDIYSLTDPGRQEELQVEGLKESVEHILAIVHEEVKLLHPSSIVILGISQGCATAIHALLAGQYRLGGFVGLSGWMPFRNQLMDEAKSCSGGLSLTKFYENTLALSDVGLYDARANATTPALLCHCADDEVVDVELGDQLNDALLALDMEVTFQRFASGGHWIPGPEGFDAIIDFLRTQVGM